MAESVKPQPVEQKPASLVGSTIRFTSGALGDKVDIFFAILVCLIFSGVLVCFSIYYRNGEMLWPLILAGVTFAVIGWATGIVLSPYNTDEQSTFSQVSKIVYGFVTGYLVSKADRIVNKLLEFNTLDDINTEVLIVIMFCCSGFFLSVCTTYVSRTYWHYLRNIRNKPTDTATPVQGSHAEQEAITA